MNSVVISGNVSFEPKTYATQGGKPYTSFSVEIQESRAGKTFSTYVNVSAFGDLGLKANELRRGDHVLISGKLNSSKKKEEWTLSIMANQLEKVGSQRQEAKAAETPAFDEDVPF